LPIRAPQSAHAIFGGSQRFSQHSRRISGITRASRERRDFTEAAERSRRVTGDAFRRLQELDGTDEAARARSVERIHTLL
jgi:hypothetical protein